MNGEPLQSFRVKLPVLWRAMFPALLAGALTARAWRLLQGEPFAWPDTLPLMGVAAVAVVLTHALQPTQANGQGLKLMTVWGYRRWMRWDEIASASLAKLLLQPSIRVQDRQGRVGWIARDTQGLSRLHALALVAGGARHPLARVLETPLHAL